MDVDIVKGQIGPEAVYDLALVDGKVQFTVKYEGVQASVGLVAGLSPAMFLEKLKAMIPGQVDDMLIGMLESALGLK